MITKRNNRKYQKLPRFLKPQNLLNGKDTTITVRGKNLIAQAVGTGAASVTLNPLNFGTRLTTYASLYQEFRFKRIMIKMHPAVTATSVRSDYIVSYAKTINTTSPASIADAYQLPVSRLSAQSETVPVTLMLNAATLRQGTRVWYNTRSPTGVELDDALQGIIFIIGSLAASTAQLEIGYEIQFRGQTTPAIL